MALRSGRMHVAEERVLIHTAHKTALANVRGVIDTSAPFALQNGRGSSPLRRDGRKAIQDAQRAAMLDAENARMGAKLRAIYTRDARALRHPGNGKAHGSGSGSGGTRDSGASMLGNDTRQLAKHVQREAHMEDPELDRLRRHTQQCFDQRRLARAEAVLASNVHFAARLAAAPPLVGSLRAAAEYDAITAQRLALRSRFKNGDDPFAHAEARRVRQARLLARRARRIEHQQDDEAAWMLEHGGLAAFEALKEAQEETLQQMQLLRSPSRSRSASRNRSAAATPAQRPGSAQFMMRAGAGRPGSASTLKPRVPTGEEDVQQMVVSSFGHLRHRSRSRSASPSRSHSRAHSHSHAHSRSPSKSSKQQHASTAAAAAGSGDIEEAKEQSQSQDGVLSGSDHDSSPSASPAHRKSGSGSRSRIGSGLPLRPPSRTPDGTWSTRDYLLVAAGLHFRPDADDQQSTTAAIKRGGRAKTASKQRSSGLASSKSTGVLLATRPATAAVGRLHHSVSSSMFFGASSGGSAVSPSPKDGGALDSVAAEEQLVRDAMEIESALAARKAGEARSGSSPMRQKRHGHGHSHSHGAAGERDRPSTAAIVGGYYSRPVPAPLAPLREHAAKGLSRSLSSSLDVPHSHDRAGMPRVTSLQKFMAAGRAGLGAGVDALEASFPAPLANPEVEAALQAILDEHHLHIETLEPLPSQYPPAGALHSSQPAAEQVVEAARRRVVGHAKNRAARGSVMLSEGERTAFYASNAAEIAAARQAVRANAVAASYVAEAEAAAAGGGTPGPKPKVRPASAQVPTISSTLGLLAKVDENSAALTPTAEAASASPAVTSNPAAAKATKPKSASLSKSTPAPAAAAAASSSSPVALWAETDVDEPEIAPPARPWSSPSSVPRLAFKAALAAERAANNADDGDVPHAAPPAEGAAAAAEAAATAEEEKWRGKLDWQEAEAEVPTPHLLVPAINDGAEDDEQQDAQQSEEETTEAAEPSLWDSVPLSTDTSVNDLRMLLRGQSEALAAAAAAARATKHSKPVRPPPATAAAGASRRGSVLTPTPTPAASPTKSPGAERPGTAKKSAKASPAAQRASLSIPAGGAWV